MIVTEATKKIVSDTMDNFYRVLEVWKKSNRKFDFDDLQSLFKSYVAKTMKEHWGRPTYASCFRYVDAAIIYRNPYVTSVNFSLTGYGTNAARIKELAEAFRIFDYVRAYDKRDIPVEVIPTSTNSKQISEDVTELNNINFESIINIKF